MSLLIVVSLLVPWNLIEDDKPEYRARPHVEWGIIHDIVEEYVEELAEETSHDPVWDLLAECESNGDWNINTGNGFYGGLQFTLSSWRWVGGQGYPHEATKQEQINRAERLYDRQGWEAWPSCSRTIGLLP